MTDAANTTPLKGIGGSDIALDHYWHERQQQQRHGARNGIRPIHEGPHDDAKRRWEDASEL